jgi:hypothetical protein
MGDEPESGMTMDRGRTLAGLVVCCCATALLHACAPHGTPAPPPAPSAPPSPAPTPALSARGRSTARFAVGHGAYDITTLGTVSSGADSTRPDTIRTATTLTYDARWNGPALEVVGTVVPRVTAVSGGLRGSSQSLGVPIPFRAMVDSTTGTVTFDRDTASTGCPAGGPSADQARELATSRPRSFEPGTTWQDTLTDSSCLGGVPLTSHAVRTYAVAPSGATDPVSGAAAVLVTHDSRVTMDGGGRRNGQLITLTGSGTGSTEQYFDRGTGVLLSAHTAATLDLDVGVSGRVQRLHQHADWQAKKK